MKTRRLVVKGDDAAVRAAAAAHGIALSRVFDHGPALDYQLRDSSLLADVVETPDLDAKLCRWLCEGPRSAPFPPGTLLWFSEPS